MNKKCMPPAKPDSRLSTMLSVSSRADATEARWLKMAITALVVCSRSTMPVLSQSKRENARAASSRPWSVGSKKCSKSSSVTTSRLACSPFQDMFLNSAREKAFTRFSMRASVSTLGLSLYRCTSLLYVFTTTAVRSRSSLSSFSSSSIVTSSFTAIGTARSMSAVSAFSRRTLSLISIDEPPLLGCSRARPASFSRCALGSGSSSTVPSVAAGKPVEKDAAALSRPSSPR
mmetsp:Transcript_24741/g.63352  ORF Transcript_24741/g.63352 Transcript_24741/m.63352 type:complete len:231 (+) Transcript_24741:964-1656(+)